jgi:hypothetical protein
MNRDKHEHYQRIVQEMQMAATNETKREVIEHREELLAAQWAEFNYTICSYRNEQKDLIQSDPYHFWITSEKNRIILMAVMAAYYSGIPLVIKRVAHDLGYSTRTVSNLLNEARQIGLLETKGDCKFKPSLDTVDGFVYYTNQTMKMDTLKRLCAGILRDDIGTFQVPVPSAPHPNRVNFRNYD